jgi:hypothetical protein
MLLFIYYLLKREGFNENPTNSTTLVSSGSKTIYMSHSLLTWRSLGSTVMSAQKFVIHLQNRGRIYNVIYDIKKVCFSSTMLMTFLAYILNKFKNICDLFDVCTVAGYNISSNVCMI